MQTHHYSYRFQAASNPLYLPFEAADFVDVHSLRSALARRVALVPPPAELLQAAFAVAALDQPRLRLASLEDYCAAMRMCSLWAGELELNALTRCCPGLLVQVHVVGPATLSKPSMHLSVVTFVDGSFDAAASHDGRAVLRLARADSHFRAVVSRGEFGGGGRSFLAHHFFLAPSATDRVDRRVDRDLRAEQAGRADRRAGRVAHRAGRVAHRAVHADYRAARADHRAGRLDHRAGPDHGAD